MRTGLSRQLQGERAGLINAQFDNAWLDAFVDRPATPAALPHLEVLREAAPEGLECVMWLVMRGALTDDVDVRHRFYHVPASNTAYGLLVLEDVKNPASTAS